MIKINRQKINEIYVSNDEIEKVMLNGEIIYIKRSLEGEITTKLLQDSEGNPIYTEPNSNLPIAVTYFTPFPERDENGDIIEPEPEPEEIIIPPKIVNINTRPLYLTVKYTSAGSLRTRKLRDSRGRYIETKNTEKLPVHVILLKPLKSERAVKLSFEDLAYSVALGKLAKLLIDKENNTITTNNLTYDKIKETQLLYESYLKNPKLREELELEYKDIFITLQKYINLSYLNKIEDKMTLFDSIIEENDEEIDGVQLNYKFIDDIIKLPNTIILKKLEQEWMPELNNLLAKFNPNEKVKTKYVNVNTLVFVSSYRRLQYIKEQMAYLYGIVTAGSNLIVYDKDSKVYKLQEIPEEKKEEAQANYDLFKDGLKATSVFDRGLYYTILLNKYIEHMFYYRKAHRRVFESIIEEFEEEVNGVTYNYRFKDNITALNMETIILKVVNEWMPELKGIIETEAREDYSIEYLEEYPEIEQYDTEEDIDDTMPNFDEVIPDEPVELPPEEEEVEEVIPPKIVDLLYTDLLEYTEYINADLADKLRVHDSQDAEIYTHQDENKALELKITKEVLKKRADKLDIEQLSYCKAISMIIDKFIVNDETIDIDNLTLYDTRHIQKVYENSTRLTNKKLMLSYYEDMLNSLSKFIKLSYLNKIEDREILFNRYIREDIETKDDIDYNHKYKQEIVDLTEIELIDKIETELVPEIRGLIVRASDANTLKRLIVKVDPTPLISKERINRFDKEQLIFIQALVILMNYMTIYNKGKDIYDITVLTDEQIQEAGDYYTVYGNDMIWSYSDLKTFEDFGHNVSRYITNAYFYNTEHSATFDNYIEYYENTVDGIEYNYRFKEIISLMNSELLIQLILNTWMPELCGLLGREYKFGIQKRIRSYTGLSMGSRVPHQGYWYKAQSWRWEGAWWWKKKVYYWYDAYATREFSMTCTSCQNDMRNNSKIGNWIIKHDGIVAEHEGHVDHFRDTLTCGQCGATYGDVYIYFESIELRKYEYSINGSPTGVRYRIDLDGTYEKEEEAKSNFKSWIQKLRDKVRKDRNSRTR